MEAPDGCVPHHRIRCFHQLDLDAQVMEVIKAPFAVFRRLTSYSFAWTFVNWPFFACQIVAASLSLLTSIVFGVISLLHFGKGLAHYRSSTLPFRD